jgi:dipeptidyl aminopeptidase/acylaminoacyl peptidase
MRTYIYQSAVQFRLTTFAVVSTLLLVLLNSVSVAQTGLTPEDVAKLKTVTGAVFSDDGNFAAYTVNVPADPYKENRPARTELHILNVETGESRLYYSTSSVSGVDFRPNADTITFLTTREGDATRSLYELLLDGGEAIKLFSYESNIITYEWAGDGNHLAFTANEQLPDPESTLPYQPDIFEENIPNRQAFIANIQQEEDGPQRIQVDGSVYLLRWSPDDTKIAVSAAPTPKVDDFYMFQQVFVIDRGTGEINAEINNEGKIGQIEWSPDGARLALLAGQDIHDPIDGRILIVSARGGVPRIIDRDFNGKYEQISWSENNTIHFFASESVLRSFGTIRPNGTQKRYIIEANDLIITSFDRTDDRTLFTANSSSHPNEIYVMNNREFQPNRMTDTNPWLDDVEFGRQEVVQYTSRDQAFEIEGILIYPVDFNDGDRIPIITQVHGGPEAHYSNGWLTSYSMPGQMAAARGYGVFYPNYRGSTGRGIEFVYSSQGGAAAEEYDDIVDGIDYLIESGIADRDRIGVTGGSYGGYASAWMSTYYSERFAAAVMFVGISNNISKWGTSDIPEELYLVHARERIWDDNWDKYLRNSPIYWVERSQTPILILHGAEDTRVHPSQSMELHRHLKVRKPDLPVRLIFYPGEGHGNANSTARYDYSLRLLRWFDTYLMTGNPDAEVPHWEMGLQE